MAAIRPVRYRYSQPLNRWLRTAFGWQWSNDRKLDRQCAQGATTAGFPAGRSHRATGASRGYGSQFARRNPLAVQIGGDEDG
ncbi:hypothetical protein MPRM_54490 [Mycobacterium parmense]|uniref:Uncharacterized protein n=1 Tax=Mycobacterium parmense TaxID=185642 RepID=A0A7I7Z1W4_9MYCO|nr:hypothetical protein MPRM_54490 [Mycobacterium parmense]